MKLFRCERCGQALFFENVVCLSCSSQLAFLPDLWAVCAIDVDSKSAASDGVPVWTRYSVSSSSDAARYRPCTNVQRQACNFAVPIDDPNPLCLSCRQTRVLPNLSVAGNIDRWRRMESAKRRLFYSLGRLRLLSPERPGPVFQFLADQPGRRVVTGHAHGVITLNVAEADDDERVRRRVALREPYRTLLGHLRHESGHFYWDHLVARTSRLHDFRSLFGDERADYRAALKDHYARGHDWTGWRGRYISAYASSHPWEDWAETWAHYLHMVDLLETAAAYHTRVEVPSSRGDIVDEVTSPFDQKVSDFDQLVTQWVPITLLLNSLNRSLGQDDAYPFALTQQPLEKLRFVHDTINDSRTPPER